MLSVILPVFNSEKTINRTLDSLIEQTYKNLEILIIDDCSTDKSREIIKSYTQKYSYIKLIILDKNYGACYARNIGINNSSGKFIAFIDADDVWLPTKSEEQLKFMTDNSLHFTYTDYNYVRNNIILNSIKTPHKYNMWTLMQNTSICLSTVIYNVDLCGKLLFNNVRPSTELHLYMRLFCFGDGFKFNKNTTFYNLSPNSMSGNKFEAAKIAYYKYQHYLGMSGPLFYILFFKYLLNASIRHGIAKIKFLINNL
jgi:teichuronic acid biosynthesis glycosyltransferase TuaG